MPTVAATTRNRMSASRGGKSGCRRAARMMIASTAAGTARPTPTITWLKEASAACVAGKVMLKHSRPSAPSSGGDAFHVSREVLLLALMNNDSSMTSPRAMAQAMAQATAQAPAQASPQASALAAVEDLVGSLPPGSKLPSYRDLQQRYRLSPATVQRLLAGLARRGLVVTRPGSGTFTAARRRTAGVADVSWQTPALGSRAGLGP